MSFPSVRPVRCLITQGLCTESNFSIQKQQVLETVRLACEIGIEMVQIREKLLPAALLSELSLTAVETSAGTDTLVLVNERFDVAIPAGADGVHLTSASIPIEVVRRCVPQGFIIGVSTHSGSEAVNARDGGADFVMFGPVFETPGKGAGQGLAELSEVCRRVAPFPVLAIGGIDSANAEDVLAAGSSGFAAIRYLNDFVKIAE